MTSTTYFTTFTPLSALIGGAMIGLAAAALLLLNGRIAGVSGILGGLLKPRAGDTAWRMAFVLGLAAAPFVYALFDTLPAARIGAGTWVLVFAGLLVGVGTRYASGCTSGHGVCGLSRLSLRSLAATLSFMAGGFFTVYVTRHML
jgi:uncharacterized membrane protein YedE/YeeE